MKSEIKPQPKIVRWLLVGAMLVAFGMHLWGIRRDLPYIPDFDEPIYVERAVRMAAAGNPNPEWFGNPGSTTFYPLAGMYHLWYAGSRQGTLFQANPGLLDKFATDSWEFYLLGRFLSVAYLMLSLPLIYLSGRTVFGTRPALIGVVFFMFYSQVIFYSRMVRTDSAALFFGLLSLWFMLKVYRRPTLPNHILAGGAIGLSVASRYFMVMLVPILLSIDGLYLWQRKSKSVRLELFRNGVIGLGAVALLFSLTTPYFFLDFETAVQNLTVEARGTALGFDGLSPVGNFIWYWTEAIPEIITWPQMALAVIGMVLIIQKRRFDQLILLGFVLIFLAAISYSSLHWPRWTIQILPLFALFAAHALEQTVSKISMVGPEAQSRFRPLLIVSSLLCLLWPAYTSVAMNLRVANFSTRISARTWVIENLPADSKIILESYTAPLQNTSFAVVEAWALPHSGYTLDSAYQSGYHYLAASSSIYDRFFAEPDRYPMEITFYQTLFEQGKLLQKFTPSLTQGGPTIQIYELQDAPEPADVSMFLIK